MRLQRRGNRLGIPLLSLHVVPAWVVLLVALGAFGCWLTGLVSAQDQGGLIATEDLFGDVESLDLAAFFESIDGPATFVLAEGTDGTVRYYNPTRGQQRFIPASTFKIVNTLIALEREVVDGPDFMLPWDPERTPPQSFWPRAWQRDQTLRSAFQNSVYWYYQEIARRIGPGWMRYYLQGLPYGNRSLAPRIDLFWLEGELRISPFEQVELLRKLDGLRTSDPEDRLTKLVSLESWQLVRELMQLEEGDGFVLRGKTGTAEVTQTRELGWLVGMVDVDSGSTWYYALNMEGERVWEEWPPQKRKQLVLRILTHVGVLPDS